MKFNRLIFSLLAIVILFTGCGKDNIVENARMTISVSEMAFERAPAQGQTLVVKSNRKWKVKDLPEWVTVSVNGKDILDEVMPAGETTVTISLAENNGEEREYSLLFNGGNVANKTLAISQAGIPINYDKIADVKKLLGTQSSVTLPDSVRIKGVIVSNLALSNQTSKKNIIVQDSTGGFIMRLTENATFALGDVVDVKIGGQTLTKFNEAFQINNISSTLFKVKEEATEVEPFEADIETFIANGYEGQYISLKDVQVADAHLGKTWGYLSAQSSNTSINMVAKSGQSFVIFSSQYSTFKDVEVPKGSGTISGVATRSGSTIQLMFAKETDWENLTGERFEAKSDTVTVTQALDKEANTDVTVFGRVVKLIKGGFILNDGNQNCIYIYNGNGLQYDLAENDVIEVKGNISIYGVTEIIPYKIKSSTKDIPAIPDLKVNKLTPAQIKTFSSKAAVQVMVEGTFTYDSSGPYYNLAFDGVTDITGSLKVSDGVELSDYHGKKVKATGFYVGQSSKYFNIAITSEDDVYDDYLALTPTSTKIKADSTSTTFAISSNRSWTITADAGYTAVPSSGDGDAQITVTFAANTDTNKEKTGVITVTPVGRIDPVKYTVTQDKAFDPNRLTLTQEEIVAGLKEVYKSSKSSGFQNIEITGATTGKWTGNANITVASDTVSCNYLWLRNKPSSGIKSPTFSKNISKIVINLNDKTTSTTLKYFAIPASFDLTKVTTNNYSASTFATNYGMGTRSDTGTKSIEITFNADTKDFTIAVVNGSVYINSIEVYLKKDE